MQMKFINTDKILIVGGSGFIGSHLVMRCKKESNCVTNLGFEEKLNVNSDVETIVADISDKRQLEKALAGRFFDYVFNLGGYIDHTAYFKEGRKSIDSHFFGLMNLLDCLDNKNLKGFVQIGSSDEYGCVSAPQKESCRENPISPYSLAKVAGSHFVQMLNMTENFPGVVARLFLVYGPFQDNGRFLPQIIRFCLEDKEFKTSEGKQLRDFCYVDDVVDALIRAAIMPSCKGHVLNIASGKPVLIRDAVEKIMEKTGGGKPIWGAFPYRKAENMALYPDISLAKKLLKWIPSISFDEGLSKTIDYYRSTI